MWTSLWIMYCSLRQLIIMLCGTHHVYWCNVYWVFINLETAWFAKFYIGHSKLSHQMQSEARLNGILLLPGYSFCWCRAWSVFFHHYNGGHLQKAWPECTDGNGARSMPFPPPQFGSATCTFMYISPTFNHHLK